MLRFGKFIKENNVFAHSYAKIWGIRKNFNVADFYAKLSGIREKIDYCSCSLTLKFGN